MEQKTIRQLIEVLRDNTEYKPTDICNRPMFYLDADAGKMISDALEATMWIPCEERLPEKNGNYLVTSKIGFVSMTEWDNVRSPDSWHNEPTWMFDELRTKQSEGFVVAWMPLPNPYEPNKA